MPLFLAANPDVTFQNPTNFSSFSLISGKVDLFTQSFGGGFIVGGIFGPKVPNVTRFANVDFPPTPAFPQAWMIGIVQNVISHKITIKWQNDNLPKSLSNPFVFTDNVQRLDADDGTFLPYIRQDNGPGLPPAARPVLYGNPVTVVTKTRQANVPWKFNLAGGPLWDANGAGGPFSFLTSDGPSISVSPFVGGGPPFQGKPNPVLEISRELTVQFWLTAVSVVPVDQRLDASKHFTLAYSDQITLHSKCDRPPDPTIAIQYHTDPADFTISPDPFQIYDNSDNKHPPAVRPVVTGALSVDGARQWLKNNNLAPSP
jgi:hypothetical protein